MKSTPSWTLFAARTLLDRLSAMRDRIGPVRAAEQAEAVHQMRVASRRMRAALAVCDRVFPKKRRLAWREEIRRVTRSLGAARDLDVQIEFLNKYLAEADRDSRPGAERLLLRLNQRRDKLHRRVVAAMDRIEKSDAVADMADRLHTAIVTANQQGAADRDPALYDQARRQITQRLDDLMAYRTYVDRPKMTEALHEMRVVAKRLRYTLEVFAPLYDNDGLAPAISAARKLQNRLGDLHDCDIWIDQLPAFFKAESKRHIEFHGHGRGLKRIERGIDRLLDNRRSARRHAYQRFARMWLKIDQRGTWDALRKLLERGKTNPPADDPPAMPTPPVPVEVAAAPERIVTRPLSKN